MPAFAATVMVPPSAARSAAPLAEVDGEPPPLTPYIGIVTVYAAPVSGLLVIGPSYPGNDAVESFAAVAIALTPAAGEPEMYGFGPLLPDERTVMTPLSARLLAATESGSSGEPNEAPSDMFTTSMLFVNAQSIAAMRT